MHFIMPIATMVTIVTTATAVWLTAGWSSSGACLPSGLFWWSAAASWRPRGVNRCNRWWCRTVAAWAWEVRPRSLLSTSNNPACTVNNNRPTVVTSSKQHTANNPACTLNSLKPTDSVREFKLNVIKMISFRHCFKDLYFFSISALNISYVFLYNKSQNIVYDKSLQNKL